MTDYDEPDALSKLDVRDIAVTLNLPEFPDDGADDDEARTLVLYRQRQENIVLIQGVSLADAQDYCSDSQTSGDGWFVGYRY